MKLSPAAGGRAWLGLSALLGLGALLAWFTPGASAGLDWQPQLVWQEPWRACSAVFVHWSPQHLIANLGACAVVGWFGWAARVPPRAVLAFALAWPLSQWGLLIQPDLLHFGGLSGYLHAGVAVVLVELIFGPERTPRQRRIGLAVSLGLIIKLWSEQPFGPAMRVLSGWDIAVAPLSHFTGALAGAGTAGLLLFCSAASRPR